MATLFQGSNTYVSTEVVEHDGQSYDPATLVGVIVNKESGLVKGMIVGGTLAVMGIYCLTKGWQTFGLILLIGGGLWGLWHYYLNGDNRATTFVTASFSGGRHTGKPDVFTAVINSYTKALDLQAALWKSKEVADE